LLASSHPTDSGDERLPAYSGATVPAFHRLPARKPGRRHSDGRRPFLAEEQATDAFAQLFRARRVPVRRLSGHAQSSAAIGTNHVRIVALAPFVTDDAFATGCGSNLVGVSSFTDDARVRSLPRVADAFSVDAERIVALRPDVAIGIRSQARQTEALRHTGVDVVLLDDDGFARIFANLRTIGTLCGRSAQAATAVSSLQRTTAALHAQTRAFRRKPSVFVVLGNAPIWTAGNSSFVASLIALAGGSNAAAGLESAYSQYSAEALLRAQPDAIVVDPTVHLDTALATAPWNQLQAVRAHRVFVVRPAAMLVEPGPNYNDGIRWLIQRLRRIAMTS
jgi:iron complex transport system substrate-binding protein